MYEQMIEKLDMIYQLQRKKFEEIDQININPYYGRFGQLEKQRKNVETVQTKYNDQMNTLYQEVNQYREQLELKPLQNPYTERN